MIKLVIFDLDGTLLNTLEDLADSTNYALKTLGFPLRTIDEVRNFVGNGVAKLIERAIPKGRENEKFEECLEIFKKNYAQNMNNKTMPYDGIINLLQNLKSKNYKIAVVSNKFVENPTTIQRAGIPTRRHSPGFDAGALTPNKGTLIYEQKTVRIHLTYPTLGRGLFC